MRVAHKLIDLNMLNATSNMMIRKSPMKIGEILHNHPYYTTSAKGFMLLFSLNFINSSKHFCQSSSIPFSI